jgi:hypothetical protein
MVRPDSVMLMCYLLSNVVVDVVAVTVMMTLLLFCCVPVLLLFGGCVFVYDCALILFAVTDARLPLPLRCCRLLFVTVALLLFIPCPVVWL